MKIKTLDDLKKVKEEGLKLIYPDRVKIAVGMATCGLAAGAKDVFEAISGEVKKQNLDAVLAGTGCLGICQKEPLVDIITPGKPRQIGRAHV